MPLRSVEAATRDDAIAAAREQFGPSARVVGVRRVRSGGVLGFFATERYVAEVAPDMTARPAVPVPATSRSGDVRDDVAPADFSSPLASATPARARSAAPARNGAAAWAAEARSSGTGGATPRTSPTSSRPASPAAPAPWAEQERVSELAGLLAGAEPEPEPEPPAYTRAAFPRATVTPFHDEPRPATPAVSFPAASFPAASFPAASFPAASVAAGPSPFTAALARMVAGDRDVRQAVADALDEPRAPHPAASTPRSSWPTAVATADTAVPSPATHQEEETVGEQVIAPPSTDTPAAEVPVWTPEPEAPAQVVSSREEAIAEVLRAALAQGHSDEALAGILRKVLAGASPQSALTEPDLPGDVAVEETVVAELAEVDEVIEPVVEVEKPQVEETPEPVGPFAAAPVVPLVVEAPFMPRVAASYWAVPAPLPAPATSMWGSTVSQAKLWGDPVVPVVKADAPIWAEVVLRDPATVVEPVAEIVEPVAEIAEAEVAEPEAEIAEPVAEVVEPVAEIAEPETEIAEPETEIVEPEAEIAEPVAEVVEPEAEIVEAEVAEPVAEVAEPVAEVVEPEAEVEIDEVVQEPADEWTESADDVLTSTEQAELAAAEEIVEEFLAEIEIAEIAPVLARTASDPAPMMSLDTTTVMPPLSLLPPLPGTRGRGRPPVPPSVSRSAIPSFTPNATPAAPPAVDTDEADAAEGDAPAVEPPGLRSLATVTRLSFAPLPATPQAPEMPEPDDYAVEEPKVSISVPASEPAAPVQQATPAAVVVPRAATPPAPGDVRGRLEALGLPQHLLGPSFADDVERHGAYAALTHALALGLPRAPEVPNGPGETLFVVGPGVEALRAARSLAASLRLDPDRVQWATRGDLAGLAPRGSRMTTIDTAIERRQDALAAGTVTIVAVDAPLRADAYWMTQMLAVWTPVAVWAVVEATRKPEDLEPWLDELPRVDALVVQDTEFSADPAAVLRRVAAPVAMVDGVRATPHRWASLLCERLEGPQA